jgi:polysaccharide biosynthesis/export protein
MGESKSGMMARIRGSDLSASLGAASRLLVSALLIASVVAAPVSAQVNPYGYDPQGFGQNQQGYGQSPGSLEGQGGVVAPSLNPNAPPPAASAVPATAAQAGQPVQIETNDLSRSELMGIGGVVDRRFDEAGASGLTAPRPPARPGEFEKYVEQILGRRLPRFGASLLVPTARDFTAPPTASVPADYVLKPGDELRIGITGSVESEMRLTLDNEGRVFIPRVGAVSLAGVRYGDARALLTERLGQQYRDFRLSVTVSRLRGIRVYLTGFAAHPGAYTVSSLATLVNAVLAGGGPAAGGSFRSIKVRRNGQLISDFDLYELLLNGDKSRDVSLENEDVIFIGPVGPEVAVTGSLNAEAIYEAKPGETLGDLLRFAGGVSTLADPSRVVISRLSDLDKMGWTELPMAQTSTSAVQGGEILRVLSTADFARPQERQAILVKIEGEVERPGHYYLPPSASLQDAMALAGGLTSRAFVYGTEFDRASVQQQQQKSFDDAIRELELSLAAAPLSASIADISDAGSRATQLTAARSVLDRLRERKPDGRVILSLPPEGSALPGDIILENNDRVYIPPRPTTVGVFGAVFRPGSFRIGGPRKIKDYLELAGGAQRVADKSQIFVVRANGEVVSRKRGVLGQYALPGDVVFVPVKTHSSSIWAKIRDISSIVFSFGLSAAAIAALTN